MRESRFTANLERAGGLHVALCPELDIASQGATIGEARASLQGAVELFLETASAQEIADREERSHG